MERRTLKNTDSIDIKFDKVFVIGSDQGNGNMYATENASMGDVRNALLDTLQVVIVEAVSAHFERTTEHAALADYLLVAMKVGVEHIQKAKVSAARGMTYNEFNSSVNKSDYK